MDDHIYVRTIKMSNRSLRVALVQERPDQPFYSGSAIKGNVLLDVTEPKSYKYVSIKFVGRSYVYWEERRTETSGNEQRHVTYRYRSEQSFADQDLMLWTCQQAPDGKLPAAEYSWPFSFTVPPLAPSSFEGTVGNIRYWLEARVGTGLLKFDHVVEVVVPIHQLVKITDPRLLLPERVEAEKTLCCLCCASGPITLNASIPKTGFCLRESFTLHVSIENGSSRHITLEASIHQLVIYRAQSRQRSNKKTLAKYDSDPIEPRSSREWDPTIEIPVTEIVHAGSCENIEVQYSLVVSASVPGALDLSRSFPLQLANCSVQQQEGQNPAFPAASGPGYPPSTPSAYPPPATSGYPPPASSAYPPQQPPGAPIGWQPPNTGLPAEPDAGQPPSGKPPTVSNEDSDSSSDDETGRLL